MEISIDRKKHDHDDIVQDDEKFPFCRERSNFSSLVSTLDFVLGPAVQLPQESARSLFSYTPPK